MAFSEYTTHDRASLLHDALFRRPCRFVYNWTRAYVVTFYGMISDIYVTGLLLHTHFWTLYHVFLPPMGLLSASHSYAYILVAL